MLIKNTILILILVLSGISSAVENVTPVNSIIFISDTQEPLWLEKIFRTTNRNTEARNLIFDNIIKTQPDAIFHMGDLVASGYSEVSWKPIDNFLVRIKKQGIPFFPTLGNHEFFIFPEAGMAQFAARFPNYSPTGSLQKIGSVAIILLNSNFSQMDQYEMDMQQNWYEDALRSCDADTTIKAVVVGCHHPPYTDSEVISFDQKVRNNFVPPFIRNYKTVLFLSGHSHAFEHFVQEKKHFLVIGGGGGLQHQTEELSEVLPERFIRKQTDVENFFYLQASTTDRQLSLRVQMLRPDFSGFNTQYRFDILYNTPGLRLISQTDYEQLPSDVYSP